ncbi:hypothetical protein VKS41_003545 [Umbelopsis sp. WA50703]
MAVQLSARILLLALVVLIYCSSMLLFSGKTSDIADPVSDEALKVVAMAEEKDREVVIDLGSKSAEGGHPGFDWEEHDMLGDPQIIDTVNADVEAALEAEEKLKKKEALEAKKQAEKDALEKSTNATSDDQVSDNTLNQVTSVDKDSEADSTYDREEALPQDEEDTVEDGSLSANDSEDSDKYANAANQQMEPQPADHLPLEFDQNLWEVNPRQLGLETVAEFPKDMKKASPYISDYQDTSKGTRNSSRAVCKGLKCERRANAVIVILCRNSELLPMRRTLRQFEDRFNRKYQYPYVFLNDEEFSDEFKESIKSLTSAKVTFGDINEEMWSYPEFVDQSVAADQLMDYQARGVIDSHRKPGGSLSYRHMCRFNSGFFYNHPLIQPYEYYWRVEPGVHFYCDLDYDPFLYMQDNGKQYGFNIALQELPETIPTLWDHTMNFAHLNQLNTTLLRFFGNPMEGYNLCHFWSNFEIANLNLWRRPEYQAYFNYLDSTGNFFYERWGDAIVHSLAAGMFLKKSEVHFFDDIGYKHDSFAHCTDDGIHGKCMCPEDTPNFDYMWGSCFADWNLYPEGGKTWNFLPNGKQKLGQYIMAGHKGQKKPAPTPAAKKTPQKKKPSPVNQ